MAARGLILALWLVVAALVVRYAVALPDDATRPSNGFVAIYLQARLLREGYPVVQTYDDDWFRAQVDAVLPGVIDINLNPPGFSLVALPIAGLDYRTARPWWTAVSVVCFLAAVGWLAWRLHFRGPWLPGFLVYALAFQPVRENFHLGQIYTILLVGLVLVWEGYRGHRDALAGVPLGLMSALKLAAFPLWPLFAVQRLWRALAWGVAAVAAVLLVPAAWIPFSSWTYYARWMTAVHERAYLAVTAYQTQTSLARHLFTYDAEWNRAPLAVAPAAATALAWLGIGISLGVPLALAWRAPRSDALFAALVAASLIASTLALDYHYCLLLLPIGVLVAWARRQRSTAVWVALAAALVLIGADLPYRSPRLATGLWALLAYPKLYGAWLLWGLAVWAAWPARGRVSLPRSPRAGIGARLSERLAR